MLQNRRAAAWILQCTDHHSEGSDIAADVKLAFAEIHPFDGSAEAACDSEQDQPTAFDRHALDADELITEDHAEKNERQRSEQEGIEQIDTALHSGKLDAGGENFELLHAGISDQQHMGQNINRKAFFSAEKKQYECIAAQQCGQESQVRINKGIVR